MAREKYLQEFHQSLEVIQKFAPYTVHPGYGAWIIALEQIEDMYALLEVIERARPGLIHSLAEEACLKIEAETRAPQAVIDLIGRYSSRGERP
jgi:hypothetical protein